MFSEMLRTITRAISISVAVTLFVPPLVTFAVPPVPDPELGSNHPCNRTDLGEESVSTLELAPQEMGEFELIWNTVEGFSIVAGGTLYITAAALSRTEHETLANSLYLGGFAMNFFSCAKQKIQDLSKNCTSSDFLYQASDSAGHIITTAGLALLISGETEMGGWIASGGLLIKSTALNVKIYLDGTKDSWLDLGAKIGLLGFGATASSVVYAVGTSIDSQATITAGNYGLGSTVTLAGSYLLSKNLKTLWCKLKEHATCRCILGSH
jgi:hypothetical protein